MVVISALRYDALELSPPLQKLLASKEFRRDAISLELNAGPPSLSVPQWLALGTGASDQPSTWRQEAVVQDARAPLPLA